MFVEVKHLVGSLLRFGTLVRAMDNTAANWPHDYGYDCPVNWNVFLPTSAIVLTLEGLGLGRPRKNSKYGLFYKRSHVGLLGILCKLYRPVTQSQNDLIRYLESNGISRKVLSRCMIQCRRDGYLRKLSSRPDIGRAKKSVRWAVEP